MVSSSKKHARQDLLSGTPETRRSNIRKNPEMRYHQDASEPLSLLKTNKATAHKKYTSNVLANGTIYNPRKDPKPEVTSFDLFSACKKKVNSNWTKSSIASSFQFDGGERHVA